MLGQVCHVIGLSYSSPRSILAIYYVTFVNIIGYSDNLGYSHPIYYLPQFIYVKLVAHDDSDYFDLSFFRHDAKSLFDKYRELLYICDTWSELNFIPLSMIKSKIEGRVYRFYFATLNHRKSFSSPEFLDSLDNWCEEHNCILIKPTPSELSIIIIGGILTTLRKIREIKKFIHNYYTTKQDQNDANTIW